MACNCSGGSGGGAGALASTQLDTRFKANPGTSATYAGVQEQSVIPQTPGALAIVAAFVVGVGWIAWIAFGKKNVHR